MTSARVWLFASAHILRGLGLGALVAFLVGWFFDSLAVALTLFALWAIVSAPFAWRAFTSLRQAAQVFEDIPKHYQRPAELTDIDEMNRDEWNRQLADIVSELGIDNPAIQICVYPEHTYDINATPLFTVRPNDLQATLSRLSTEFRGGSFWVTVFVKGRVRRRFTLFAKP